MTLLFHGLLGVFLVLRLCCDRVWWAGYTDLSICSTYLCMSEAFYSVLDTCVPCCCFRLPRPEAHRLVAVSYLLGCLQPDCCGHLGYAAVVTSRTLVTLVHLFVHAVQHWPLLGLCRRQELTMLFDAC